MHGSLWLTNSFYGSKKNALYLRKFATNIESSVIPQFLSQVQCLHLHFDIKKNSIQNQYGKKLYFMGIESSQTSADSKLKSIPNLERVLIEEATEISEEEYTKLNLSIRDKDSFPKIVLTFNPNFQEHWIYKKFYEQRGVDYDFIGVKDGVLYIHTTFLDNIDNLDESFLREAENCKKYDPVKYARDFEGRWLNSNEEAVLSKELLDLALEKVERPNNFEQVVVALDPAVSVNENSDATGLAVCAKSNGHFYILHTEEHKFTPQQWANRCKELYDIYHADFIVYERNQGGDVIETTLRTALGTFVKIKHVTATKGKIIRFSPVHSLYEQHLIHHLGRFFDLEKQLLTYSGNPKQKSPNSLDAAVWAITSLNISGKSSFGFA